jgi:hypothetical protein
MRKPSARPSLLILGLVIGLLIPSAAEAVFCSKDLVGVRLSDQGRLEIRIDQVGGNGAGVLMKICNLRVQMGTIQPDSCEGLYAQLLAAFHTDSPISIQLRAPVLDANGLWGGSCSTLTHQGDFSSAIATIETQK